MRTAWLSLVVSAVLFGGCRVEATRSLSAERAGRTDLFYVAEDAAPDGKFEGPLSFGMGIESFEPYEPTSLAGFGGGSRRLFPPNPSGMGGLFTYCLPYTSVDLPPRAKVMMWQGTGPSGKKAVFVIVALDLVAVPADVARRIVSALGEGWPQLALTQSNVQVVASHTHAGPAGLTQNPFWGAFACDRYSPALWTFFEGRVKRAFANALSNNTPIAVTSRRVMEVPGFNKSRFKGMEVQRRLISLSFSRDAAPPESRVGAPCVQIFAVHPTWFGQRKRVLSSDVVGHAERALATVNRKLDCIFLNGAVGNADIFDTTTEAIDLDDWSSRLAELAFNPKVASWTEVEESLEYGSRIVDLPSPKPNLKACEMPPIESLVSAKILDNLPPRTKIAYARLGKTLFVFFPGEAVFNVARDIERSILKLRPDVDTVQVLSVANDYIGYVVDSNSFDTRALESCSTLYGRGSSAILQAAIADMVKRNPK